jgi:hypothetical protein
MGIIRRFTAITFCFVSYYVKRPEGCRNSSRVFAQTFGTVRNISYQSTSQRLDT